MRLLLTVSLTVVALGTSLVRCYAATCDQLWVERNSYYKAVGYCFETQRAIAYFGNGGCTITNQNAIHFTAAVQSRIDQIVQEEKAQGCSD
jgi:hypothetical protein